MADPKARRSVGIKIAPVQLTKSNDNVYSGKNLIAECRNKSGTIKAVKANLGIFLLSALERST